MIYRHEFRGAKFATSVIGLPSPRWALESFTLEDEVRQAWWHVEPGQVIIDVGAGFGSYALPALALGARVLACEPDKEALFALTTNVMINHFGSRCVLLPCAVCDVAGVVAGYDHQGHTTIESGLPMEHRLAETVDNLCAAYRLDRLDWVKIDVEGVEEQVILGALKAFEFYRPKVLVENHLGVAPGVDARIAEHMAALGYAGETRTGKGVNDNWTLWSSR